ncbi:putative adhesin [Aspergillus granulosus]|uniref:Adhesin n=1 Tax=Aspergillus granulosus TaxID=176169 RepID=A0ABR4GRJ5_9EURO
MKGIAIFVALAICPGILVAAQPYPTSCPTCNPLSGQNHCHPTTSCINTGTRFHCACRAGYKASRSNERNRQFRLNMPGYQFLVFTPEYTECNTLCDNPYGPPSSICSEVPVNDRCPI